MTEKLYRLNKWGTKLLKNNKPLFDWANEGDNIVGLLNTQHETIQDLTTKKEDAEYELLHLQEKYEELLEENKQLKKRIKKLVDME